MQHTNFSSPSRSRGVRFKRRDVIMECHMCIFTAFVSSHPYKQTSLGNYPSEAASLGLLLAIADCRTVVPSYDIMCIYAL